MQPETSGRAGAVRYAQISIYPHNLFVHLCLRDMRNTRETNPGARSPMRPRTFAQRLMYADTREETKTRHRVFLASKTRYKHYIKNYNIMLKSILMKLTLTKRCISRNKEECCEQHLLCKLDLLLTFFFVFFFV